MSDLASKKCGACEGGVPPLQGNRIKNLQDQLGEDWRVVNEHHLEKEFRFDNFKDALAYTNKIGELAEKEGHHPDIYLSWGKVRVMLCTHSIGGLSENDFILAAKIDKLPE